MPVERLREASGTSLEQPAGPLSVIPALAWTDIVRLILIAAPSTFAAPSTWPPVVCAVARAYFPSSIGSSLKELRALDARLAAAGHFRPLGDRPLVVLTALADKSQGMSWEQGRRMQAAWQKLHDDRATRSGRSRHEIGL